jgi:phage terminase large subunit-like protein
VRNSRGKKSKTPRRSTSDPVGRWAEAVVASRIVAGPHVRNACRRHLHDLTDGGKRGLFFDRAAAKRAIDFFPDVLRLSKGKFEGTPFRLEPAQQFVIGSLFGWKLKATGKRRFRRAYIEQGKGNGKSPMAAGIGMYCLVADGEAGAEVYAGASSKEQARVCFDSAVSMYEKSPALRARLVPSGAKPVWNLAHLASGSFFRPISSEGGGKSGPIPHCALCDEIHEQRDGTLIEMLERGFKSREQPFLIMITNSGSDRNSVCWEEHVNAIRAAAGNGDLHGRAAEGSDYLGDPETARDLDDTFSFVCSLDDGDDPLEDPSCWVKPNPLVGVTMPYAEIERAVRQAKAMPGKLNNILRLHFCIWTDADRAWISRKTLEPRLADFDPAEHRGKKLYVGLDLSAAQDLTVASFCVETGRVDVKTEEGSVSLPTFDLWVEAWTPLATLAERALRDKAPYETWVKQGFLNAPEGSRIRLDHVAARLAALAGEYEIVILAYDRYAYGKLADELDALGVELPEIEHPQGGKRRGRIPAGLAEDARRDGREPALGLWMPGSLEMLEAVIIDGRIRLKRNPVLISAAMGAATEKDAFDNRWFSKRKATIRIDAIVAAAMSLGAATSGLAAARASSIWDRIELWASETSSEPPPSAPSAGRPPADES